MAQTLPYVSFLTLAGSNLYSFTVINETMNRIGVTEFLQQVIEPEGVFEKPQSLHLVSKVLGRRGSLEDSALELAVWLTQGTLKEVKNYSR